ncbi:DUF3849 domain-containing protein, partial [Dysosmobacter welbionis]
ECHIHQYFRPQPSGLHGKITQDQGPQHGEGVGQRIRRVQGRQLQHVDQEFHHQQLGQQRQRRRLRGGEEIQPGRQAPRRADHQVPGRGNQQGDQEHRHPQDPQIRAHQRGKIEVIGLLGKVKKGGGQDHHRRRVVHHQDDAALHDAGGGGVRPLSVPHLWEGVVPLLGADGLRHALLRHGEGVGLDVLELVAQLVQQGVVHPVIQVAQRHVAVGPLADLQPLHGQVGIPDAAAQHGHVGHHRL